MAKRRGMLHDLAHEAVAPLTQQFTAAAERIAAAVAESPTNVHQALSLALNEQLRRVAPEAPADRDRRCSSWRARLQLYRVGTTTTGDETMELDGDTDPDLADGALPEALFTGLAAMLDWIQALMLDFHGTLPPEMQREALEARLRSFRPELSRQKGKALWRLRYAWGADQRAAYVTVWRVEG